MKILLSGISSFTGYWFAKQLTEEGHVVTGILTNKISAYQGIRALRLKNLQGHVQFSENTPFGGEKFQKLASKGCFDLYGHHSAFMDSYRSLDYDFVKAIQNDRSILAALRSLKEGGTQAVIFTGSIFEPGEGAGSDNLRGFSPYGVTKSVIFQYFKFFCQNVGLKIGKFVIPNPFGPFEEQKFTSYLMKCWHENITPTVKTPDYIRDNIHVSLLAKVYALFCIQVLTKNCSEQKINPSQYIESQGRFADRFRLEISKRIGWSCPITISKQSEFLEPLIRVNTDSAMSLIPDWNDDFAWDLLTDFYLKYLALVKRS